MAFSLGCEICEALLKVFLIFSGLIRQTHELDQKVEVLTSLGKMHQRSVSLSESHCGSHAHFVASKARNRWSLHSLYSKNLKK